MQHVSAKCTVYVVCTHAPSLSSFPMHMLMHACRATHAILPIHNQSLLSSLLRKLHAYSSSMLRIKKLDWISQGSNQLESIVYCITCKHVHTLAILHTRLAQHDMEYNVYKYANRVTLLIKD